MVSNLNETRVYEPLPDKLAFKSLGDVVELTPSRVQVLLPDLVVSESDFTFGSNMMSLPRQLNRPVPFALVGGPGIPQFFVEVIASSSEGVVLAFGIR